MLGGRLVQRDAVRGRGVGRGGAEERHVGDRLHPDGGHRRGGPGREHRQGVGLDPVEQARRVEGDRVPVGPEPPVGRVDDDPQLEVEVRVGRARAEPGDQVALGHRLALLHADAAALQVQVARDQAGPERVVVDGDVPADPVGAALDLDDPPGVDGEHAVPGLTLQVDRLVQLMLHVPAWLLLARWERWLLEPVAGLAVAEGADGGSLGPEEPVLGPQDQRRQQRRHQQRQGRMDRLEGHGLLRWCRGQGPAPTASARIASMSTKMPKAPTLSTFRYLFTPPSRSRLRSVFR